MELHQKDYLLFEQDLDGGSANKSSTTATTESIIEVDFGSLDGVTWRGFWKIGRPVVVGLIQACWYTPDIYTTTFLHDYSITK